MGADDKTEEIKTLAKVVYHLCDKAYPLQGGYRVPTREYQRLKHKASECTSTVPEIRSLADKAKRLCSCGYSMQGGYIVSASYFESLKQASSRVQRLLRG